MKRSWKIRRQMRPAPEAQIRWDHAYQLLLQLSNSGGPQDLAQSTPLQEVADEHRHLCPCLDHGPGAEPKL